MGPKDLTQSECIKLVTFRKSGAEVATPVWFLQDKDKLYCRTAEQFGKVKRLRNNALVKYAPCDWDGNVEGAWMEGQAELLSDDEPALARIDQLLDEKYGDKRKEMTRFMHSESLTPVFIAITSKESC